MTDPIVVIMQRLHELDLSGVLLKQGGWEHLCLPAEYDPTRPCSTSIGWSDPRTEEGELLFESRLPKEELDEIQRRLGSRTRAGQYQQLPSPAEGSVFKREWIRYWTPETLPEQFDLVVGSFDSSYKKTKDSHFVVGQVWGAVGCDRYLLDQPTRERLGLPGAIAAAQQMSIAHPEIGAMLIELTGNGPAVVQAVQDEIPGTIGIELPKDSKLARAHAVSPQFEAGNVYIPHPMRVPDSRWVVDTYLPELLGFPESAFDDQVDATTQALLYLAEHGGGLWIFAL
jgi:predicted phage terminase large subunit-like protein